jgi:hypothetical protein
MGHQKIKWKVSEVKKTTELDPNEVLYTRRILAFMIKVTKEGILDDLQKLGLLTEQIRKAIEIS